MLLAVDDGHLPGPRAVGGGQLGQRVQRVAAVPEGGGGGRSGDAARLDGGQQAGGGAVVGDVGAVPEQLLGGPAPLRDPARPVDQDQGEPDQRDHP